MQTLHSEAICSNMQERFTLYDGDLIGLPTSEAHAVYRWQNENCKILFSVARQGAALSCHFASDKKGLRHIKTAIDEWCGFSLDNYQWARMVIAKVEKKSVSRLIKKVGFVEVARIGDVEILVRRRR